MATIDFMFARSKTESNRAFAVGLVWEDETCKAMSKQSNTGLFSSKLLKHLLVAASATMPNENAGDCGQGRLPTLLNMLRVN